MKNKQKLSKEATASMSIADLAKSLTFQNPLFSSFHYKKPLRGTAFTLKNITDII